MDNNLGHLDEDRAVFLEQPPFEDLPVLLDKLNI